MPSTPLPVVLATLALRRRLKQLADALVPPQIAMLDLGEGVAGVQIAAAIAELGIADVTATDAEWAAHRWRRGEGLSVADRLCLALGERLDAAVWTADTGWETNTRVNQIR